MPDGEVHYSILLNPDLVYYYYFQDNKIKTISEYLISINPINCDLKTSKEVEQENNEHIDQFIIKSNEKIKLYYKNNLVNDICELTISATEYVRKNDLKNFKELIICDGIYQNYQIVKEMKYNSTKFNENENANLYMVGNYK